MKILAVETDPRPWHYARLLPSIRGYAPGHNVFTVTWLCWCVFVEIA